MSNMRDAPVLKAVAEVVKDHVGKAFAVLRGRIEAFDSRLKTLEIEATFKALADPSTSDIIDFRVKEVRERIDGVEQQIKSLPRPEKGERGDVGPVGPIGPIGESGKDGVGRKGDDGRDGKDAPHVDVEALAQKVLALVPVPKDGKDGLAGESIKGDRGDKGDRGASILSGNGPPMFAGDSEDCYIDCKTGDIYRFG